MLEGHEAEFAHAVGKALIEEGSNASRRTEAERRTTESAFLAGLRTFSYVPTPENASYLWSLLEREGVRDDQAGVFGVLWILLEYPEARIDPLRRMLALDLGRSAEAGRRDDLVGSILEDDEGGFFDGPTRHKIAAWALSDDFRAGTKRAEKRLRTLALKLVENGSPQGL